MPSIKLPALLREIHALRKEGALAVMAQGLIVGGGSGAVIGCFRLLYDLASARIATTLKKTPLDSLPAGAAVFGALLALSIIVGFMVKKTPLISGSGIPQVELAIRGKIPMPWARILVNKFAGTLLSLIGGLSVGREGPSIQMGAAVGCGVGHLWHCKPDQVPRYLIGGSVAGLTAAFGAPMAGILFAFEEVKTIISVPMALFVATAAAAAWIVVNNIFGFGLVFPFADIAGLTLTQSWMVIIIGFGMGLFGALYNAALLSVTRLYDRQRLLPIPMKPILPFMAGGLLLYVYPQVLSGVGISMDALAFRTFATSTLGFLLLVKIAFSILSFASGVPGGLLMPMLSIGGITGALAGGLALHFSMAAATQTGAFIVLCMAGLFSGTVRAPLTGAFLVIEMSGAYHCLPAAVIASYIATVTANTLGSTPVYDSLKNRILANRKKDAAIQAKTSQNATTPPNATLPQNAPKPGPGRVPYLEP